MQRVGRRGERAVVGDGAQRAQPAEVDHEARSYGFPPQSPIALVGRGRHRRGHAPPPRRSSPPLVAVDLGRQLRRHPRRPGVLPSPAVRRAAVLPRRARAPVRAAPRRAGRATWSPSASSSPPGSSALLFVGMRPGHAGRARIARAAAAGRVHGRPRRAAARRAPDARRSSRAARSRSAGIGIIAAGRASAVPLGALALTIGAAALVGRRQRRHAQGRARPTRSACWCGRACPAAAAARALPAHRARRGRSTLDAVRRARAALRRRALDAGRLRRLGLAAGPAPGLDGRAVHAARAGRRDRRRRGSRSARRRARPSCSAPRSCSAGWRSPWA